MPSVSQALTAGSFVPVLGAPSAAKPVKTVEYTKGSFKCLIYSICKVWT